MFQWISRHNKRLYLDLAQRKRDTLPFSSGKTSRSPASGLARIHTHMLNQKAGFSMLTCSTLLHSEYAIHTVLSQYSVCNSSYIAHHRPRDTSCLLGVKNTRCDYCTNRDHVIYIFKTLNDVTLLKNNDFFSPLACFVHGCSLSRPYLELPCAFGVILLLDLLFTTKEFFSSFLFSFLSFKNRPISFYLQPLTNFKR